MLCYIELPQSQLVMVSVVQDVHQVSIEWMDVVQFGELCQDGGQLVVVVLLSVFYLSSVELADARDLVMLVDDSGSLPLRL